MAIYTADSKLCDVILSEPSVIQVINRFGIFLGVGDMSIKSICQEHSLEENLFLSILNTYINRNYFPDIDPGKFFLPGLIDYLESADLYYKENLLPNIERHFSLLISKSGNDRKNSNLHLLQDFFLEVKEEMLLMIKRDLSIWFPIIKSGIKNRQEGVYEFKSNPLPYDNHILEEKISDLISFFVIHLRGEYNHNLCVAVVTALYNLDKDVKQNNRIRERILKPLCIKLLS